MNKVILVGRLTKDPEIRATPSGKKVASFSIAVDEGKNQNGERISQYFNCSAWDQLADILEMYVKKGHRLAIVGKLQNRSWDKTDGTKAYATDIQVKELELLTTKAEAESLSQNADSDSSQVKDESKSNSKASSKDGGQNDLPEIDINSIKVEMPF